MLFIEGNTRRESFCPWPATDVYVRQLHLTRKYLCKLWLMKLDQSNRWVISQNSSVNIFIWCTLSISTDQPFSTIHFILTKAILKKNTTSVYIHLQYNLIKNKRKCFHCIEIICLCIASSSRNLHHNDPISSIERFLLYVVLQVKQSPVNGYSWNLIYES